MDACCCCCGEPSFAESEVYWPVEPVAPYVADPYFDPLWFDPTLVEANYVEQTYIEPVYLDPIYIPEPVVVDAVFNDPMQAVIAEPIPAGTVFTIGGVESAPGIGSVELPAASSSTVGEPDIAAGIGSVALPAANSFTVGGLGTSPGVTIETVDLPAAPQGNVISVTGPNSGWGDMPSDGSPVAAGLDSILTANRTGPQISSEISPGETWMVPSVVSTAIRMGNESWHSATRPENTVGLPL